MYSIFALTIALLLYALLDLDRFVPRKEPETLGDNFSIPQEVISFEFCVRNGDLEPCADIIRNYFEVDVCQGGVVAKEERLKAQCVEIRSR